MCYFLPPPVHFFSFPFDLNMGRTKRAARISKIQKVPEVALEKTKPEEKTELDEDRLKFLKSLESTLLQHLPFLFDGSRGMLAWIPVEFADNSDVTHEVVTISKPMLQCYFGLQTKFKMPLWVLEKFCDEAFDDYPVEFSDEEFQRMSLKTPFKAFQMGHDNSPECMRLYFKVVCAQKFKELISDSRKLFGEQPRRLQCKPTGIGSGYALLGGSGSTGPIPELSGLDISYEDKKFLPALGTRFWPELYTPIINRFFGIRKDKKKHVVGGMVAPNCCRLGKQFKEPRSKEKKRGIAERAEERAMKRIRDEPLTTMVET